MQAADWIVVFVYCLASLALGVALTKKASKGIESFFASERKLGWWLAGTSMAATAFSSDTPLLVTGIVRRRGVWGNWEIWALALSTMLAVFFFSKLWKRTGVMTEVELCELRYSGKPAAFLRGFKALYWGVLYNAFVMGAWPVTGLAKVMQETAGWDKATSIIFCMGLTAVYATLSGYWGVILTDFFQFFVAMAGAFLLAFYAVSACGGMEKITEALSATGKLSILPPLGETGSLAEFLSSPLGWFLGLVSIQWWAWKNTDGGGIIVQRIVSCRDERQAILSTLWFNIAQYALRSWPWIVTALASCVLLPDLADHERAYPRLITLLLPSGLKGLMVASFLAAFMSTMSTHLNWGSSYFINDFYKRFVFPGASEKHAVWVGRLASMALAGLAMIVAFFTESIGEVYTFVLNLTAAVGPVYLLRWFWWRINPWSEIAAMVASLPVILARPYVLRILGVSPNLPMELVFMVVASAMIWLPATYLTAPVAEKSLKSFARRVSPPGFWKGWNAKDTSWGSSLRLWAVATAALLGISVGPLRCLLGHPLEGALMVMASLFLWVWILRQLRAESRKPTPVHTLLSKDQADNVQ